MTTPDWAIPEAEKKLGKPCLSSTVCGNVFNGYWCNRYGLDPTCVVVAGTGDNLSSAAGFGLTVGDAVVSLGTSDTLFGALDQPLTSVEGSIFCHPTEDAYLALLCYKNGSLTRESVRDNQASGSWENFNKLLDSTPPGNNGNIGFYFLEPEITPRAPSGFHYFDQYSNQVANFDSANHVRAVVEGQFLSMLVHSQKMGMKVNRIFATGGGSKNESILQVLANVFGVTVSVQDQPNSACLGAALRAFHGYLNMTTPVNYKEATKKKLSTFHGKGTNPDESIHKMYQQMASRYAKLESSIVK